MVSALGWKLHKLRPGHRIALTKLKGPGRLGPTLTFRDGAIDVDRLRRQGWS